VIFAKTEAQAVVPNPPPMGGAGAASSVEYVTPTPLSLLDDQQNNPISRVDIEADTNNNNDPSALAIPAASPLPTASSHESGTVTYGSADDLLDPNTLSSTLLQTASNKWKGARGGAGSSGKGAADSPMSPILGCILANCSVPYLTCLSSLECSAVFDCLQTTGAPIASCAKYHARMSERDKRLFGDLSDCEQRNLCFGAGGALTEPPTDAHTQPPGSPAPSAPSSSSSPAAPRHHRPHTTAPAPSAPAAPAKPAGPAKCEVLCVRKCRADRACRNTCNAECFQKRYVVQL